METKRVFPATLAEPEVVIGLQDAVGIQGVVAVAVDMLGQVGADRGQGLQGNLVTLRQEALDGLGEQAGGVEDHAVGGELVI